MKYLSTNKHSINANYIIIIIIIITINWWALEKSIHLHLLRLRFESPT